MPDLNGALERRVFPIPFKVEKRQDAKSAKLEGHAAVFDKVTKIFYFDEKIEKGAFAETIRDDGIRALFNHDSNYCLLYTSPSPRDS